jgi:hypothetical protein
VSNAPRHLLIFIPSFVLLLLNFFNIFHAVI